MSAQLIIYLCQGFVLGTGLVILGALCVTAYHYFKDN